jgi:hypothetical protein
MSSLLLCSVVTACAQAAFCKLETEVYPESPFTLEVILATNRATIGQPLRVEYVLTNIATVPVAACAENLGEYHFIGSDDNRGLLHSSTATAPLSSVIRLLPGTSLKWTSEVRVPDIGEGNAQFIGVFNSWCEQWSGKVKSAPVELTVMRDAEH